MHYQMLARQHTGSEDDQFRLGVFFGLLPPSVSSRRAFFLTGAQFRTRGIAFQPGTISVFGSITFPLLPVTFDMLKAHSTQAMLGNGDFPVLHEDISLFIELEVLHRQRFPFSCRRLSSHRPKRFRYIAYYIYPNLLELLSIFRWTCLSNGQTSTGRIVHSTFRFGTVVR